MALKIVNMDAAESVHFSRDLEQIRGKTYDTKFPEFKGRSFVPVDHSVNPGAEVVTYRRFTEVGYAEWARDYSKGPRVDVYGEETTTKVRGLKASYGYSMQEARAAQMQGQSLDARKANSARRAIEQLIDKAAFVGNGTDFEGLLTLSNTCTYATPAGATGSKSWADKSPEEILADMFGMEATIINTTLDIHHANTLVLPLSSYQIIATRRIGDGSDQTILKHFLANAVSINSVERSHKLESTTAAGGGSWTGKRAVAYQKDADVLQLVMPLEFNQLAPQWDGFEVVTQCEARTGGVVCYYPKAVCYADEI